MSFPSNWKNVKFGDIAQQIVERIDDPQKSGYNSYIGLEHIESEQINIQKYGDAEEVKSSKFLCQKGDIIFGRRRAYLRKLAVCDRDSLVSTDAMVIRPKKEVIKEYLILMMQTDYFWEKAISLSAGSLSPRVKWRELSTIEFYLPPLDVQKKISDILWSFQDNLEKIEKLIQITEKLKKELLEELLIKGIGHKKFQKTELGEIPDMWKIVTLSSVLKPNFGIRITQKNETGTKFPVYGGGGISFWTDTFNREDEFVVSRFAMSEECVRYVKGKFYMLDSGFTIESIDDSVLKEYLGLFLSIFQNKVYSQGRGPAQKNLDVKEFLTMPFPKPSLDEQKIILSLYNNFEKSKETLLSNLSNILNLKKKLVNSFLSGELLIPKEAII